PTRSPSFAITATCTEPATPASTAKRTTSTLTAASISPDAERAGMAGARPWRVSVRCQRRQGGGMVRAFVLYESKPDPERYEQHAELCRQVPGGTFRHGPVFGAPMGEPAYAYYAEWEFPDREAFGAAA